MCSMCTFQCGKTTANPDSISSIGIFSLVAHFIVFLCWVHVQQLICGRNHCIFIPFSLFQILFQCSVYSVNNYSMRDEQFALGVKKKILSGVQQTVGRSLICATILFKTTKSGCVLVQHTHCRNTKSVCCQLLSTVCSSAQFWLLFVPPRFLLLSALIDGDKSHDKLWMLGICNGERAENNASLVSGDR